MIRTQVIPEKQRGKDQQEAKMEGIFFKKPQPQSPGKIKLLLNGKGT
jgi:hypothetical protein